MYPWNIHMVHKFPELQALFCASVVPCCVASILELYSNTMEFPYIYFHCVEITFSVPVSTLDWDILVGRECVLSILHLFNEYGSWLIVDG